MPCRYSFCPLWTFCFYCVFSLFWDDTIRWWVLIDTFRLLLSSFSCSYQCVSNTYNYISHFKNAQGYTCYRCHLCHLYVSVVFSSISSSHLFPLLISVFLDSSSTLEPAFSISKHRISFMSRDKALIQQPVRQEEERRVSRGCLQSHMTRPNTMLHQMAPRIDTVFWTISGNKNLLSEVVLACAVHSLFLQRILWIKSSCMYYLFLFCSCTMSQPTRIENIG